MCWSCSSLTASVQPELLLSSGRRKCCDSCTEIVSPFGSLRGFLQLYSQKCSSLSVCSIVHIPSLVWTHRLLSWCFESAKKLHFLEFFKKCNNGCLIFRNAGRFFILKATAQSKQFLFSTQLFHYYGERIFITLPEDFFFHNPVFLLSPLFEIKSRQPSPPAIKPFFPLKNRFKLWK